MRPRSYPVEAPARRRPPASHSCPCCHPSLYQFLPLRAYPINHSEPQLYQAFSAKILSRESPCLLAMIVYAFLRSAAVSAPSDTSLSTSESDTRYVMRLSAEYCSGRSAPVLPIAFPAAEFPSLVPIAHKLLPALLAYQRVICFFIHLRLVRVPPPHPASVRTEPFFLPAFVLRDRLSALRAGVGILRPRMPPQVGLHCI